MKPGDKIVIHAYKHDGTIYTKSENNILLRETDEYLVLANQRSRVTEEDGRTWYTREPAIIYFYKDRWFNIIAQLKKQDLFYYCNIASPYIIEGNVIKYIDYDLDLRVFPDGSYKILDEGEYKHHKQLYNYSEDIDQVVHYELENLIDICKVGGLPFRKESVKRDYEKFLKLIQKKA